MAEATLDITTWDTCAVTFRPSDDPAYGMFSAHATGPHGDYLANESIEFPIDMDFKDSGGLLLPLTGRNRNKLSIFLTSLQNDSWELLPDDPDAPWYEKQLRRPTREPMSTRVTRQQWRWVIGIVLLLSLPVAYVIRTWTNPFPLGVRNYMEMEPVVDELAEYRNPHYRGKILVVNPLPVRVTDPLSGRPDPIHWLLPDEMRADTTEEIGTVVWVACRTYFRSKMVSRDCEITTFYPDTLEVIDFREISSDQYQGPIPARERIGLRDEEAIFNYITSLPPRE